MHLEVSFSFSEKSERDEAHQHSRPNRYFSVFRIPLRFSTVHTIFKSGILHNLAIAPGSAILETHGSSHCIFRELIQRRLDVSKPASPRISYIFAASQRSRTTIASESNRLIPTPNIRIAVCTRQCYRRGSRSGRLKDILLLRRSEDSKKGAGKQ